MRCENETTEVLQRAKRIITEEVEKAGCRVVKVILFGSRARGDARADSDWDFLVVVDRELPVSQLWDIADDIRLRLARSEFLGRRVHSAADCGGTAANGYRLFDVLCASRRN
jgi:predicted nucleotidyltransferase